MKPQVDPHLEEVYLNILIEKLQKPDEWKKLDSSGEMKFNSSCIGGTKTYFRTAGRDGSSYDVYKVFIRGESNMFADTEIHTLPINKRIARKLIRKLYEYMKLQDEWKVYEELDKKLKKALPENIDRYLKLTKIRKNL